jgi:hypothetical protein
VRLEGFFFPPLSPIWCTGLISQFLNHFTDGRTPWTGDQRSKACTIFARSEAGVVGSNPTQDMDVWYVLCV